MWSYAILFFVVFAETGLVITPFLPGDSLLFAAGALAAKGSFQVSLLAVILYIAVLAGDNVNYWFGRTIGKKLYEQDRIKFIKKEYIERTHNFYAKHGGKTIILARYVPIVRTFAPFVAGIGEMKYLRFLSYSIAGGITWVSLFVFGGFFFGNLSFVKNNFPFVIIAIVLISILPGVVEFLRQKFPKQESQEENR
jgi:membrane-associated protein